MKDHEVSNADHLIDIVEIDVDLINLLEQGLKTLNRFKDLSDVTTCSKEDIIRLLGECGACTFVLGKVDMIKSWNIPPQVSVDHFHHHVKRIKLIFKGCIHYKGGVWFPVKACICRLADHLMLLHPVILLALF